VSDEIVLPALSSVGLKVAAAFQIDVRRSSWGRKMSHVSEHAELAWILTCFSPIGEHSRMTQSKDKRSQDGGARI